MKTCPACNSKRYKEIKGTYKCTRCGFINKSLIESDAIMIKPKPEMKKCKECGTEFEQSPKARYPRKFCDKCSKQRKKAYEELWKVTADECDDE